MELLIGLECQLHIMHSQWGRPFSRLSLGFLANGDADTMISGIHRNLQPDRSKLRHMKFSPYPTLDPLESEISEFNQSTNQSINQSINHGKR
jgi:hypothetical protein